MRAKIYSSKVIDVITDDRFDFLVDLRAKEISKKNSIDYKESYEIALEEISSEYKNFVFVPLNKDEYNNEFAIFEPVYFESDGVITNKWEVNENVNISEMQVKVNEYEKELKNTDNKIIEFFERMIMGQSIEHIRTEANELITKRDNLRSRITDINELVNRIINSEK